jgi:hypothetical protein
MGVVLGGIQAGPSAGCPVYHLFLALAKHPFQVTNQK